MAHSKRDTTKDEIERKPNPPNSGVSKRIPFHNYRRNAKENETSRTHSKILNPNCYFIRAFKPL